MKAILFFRNPNYYAIQVHRNVYGSKVSGRFWNYYTIKKIIQEAELFHSRIDKCVLYKFNKLCLLYTDDSILAGPD